MDNKYTKAYKEVLEIIKCFSEEEYNKIPKEKIKFFENNMDKDYEFSIDPEIDLSYQNISKEAKAIIVALYQDYFATEEQKEKTDEILKLNELKTEQKKREKYAPDKLFHKECRNENVQKVITEKGKKGKKVEVALVSKKDNFFTRFKNFIIRILNIK